MCGSGRKLAAHQRRKLYVANLKPTTTGEDLLKQFSQWGVVVDSTVLDGRTGHGGKRAGFVTYSAPEEAAAAMAACADIKTCTVKLADARGYSEPHEAAARGPPYKLYVANLPPKTTKDDVQRAFAPFGTLLDCHMHDRRGMGERRSCFVTFRNFGEAQAALDRLGEGAVCSDNQRMTLRWADPKKGTTAPATPRAAGQVAAGVTGSGMAGAGSGSAGSGAAVPPEETAHTPSGRTTPSTQADDPHTQTSCLGDSICTLRSLSSPHLSPVQQHQPYQQHPPPQYTSLPPSPHPVYGQMLPPQQHQQHPQPPAKPQVMHDPYAAFQPVHVVEPLQNQELVAVLPDHMGQPRDSCLHHPQVQPQAPCMTVITGSPAQFFPIPEQQQQQQRQQQQQPPVLHGTVTPPCSGTDTPPSRDSCSSDLQELSTNYGYLPRAFN